MECTFKLFSFDCFNLRWEMSFGDVPPQNGSHVYILYHHRRHRHQQQHNHQRNHQHNHQHNHSATIHQSINNHYTQKIPKASNKNRTSSNIVNIHTISIFAVFCGYLLPFLPSTLGRKKLRLHELGLLRCGAAENTSPTKCRKGGKWEAKIGGDGFGVRIYGCFFFPVGEGVKGPEIGSVRKHGSEDRNMWAGISGLLL